MSAPRTFISYSWDDDEHKTWVRELATSLRKDGVDVTLDQWHVQPGDQLPAFMERAIRESDFVLIVCTPKYKTKSDERSKGGGGVAYEGDVIQGEVFTRHNHRKFIPILRKGNWIDSAPAQLLGKAYIGLQDEEMFQSNYPMLLRTLHGIGQPIPELGSKPEFSFAPSLRAPVQDQERAGLDAGGTVIRRGGNRPFVGKSFGFSFSRDFQGMLDIAETSDFGSMPRVSAHQIKRIDFKEYSAAEIALIKKSDPSNVINYSPSWCRFRKAIIERLDNTTEEVFLMCTETLYGPEGESYTLGQTFIQGVVSD
jgi:TIR domain